MLHNIFWAVFYLLFERNVEFFRLIYTENNRRKEDKLCNIILIRNFAVYIILRRRRRRLLQPSIGNQFLNYELVSSHYRRIL